ncbi:MAG: 3-hydroxyacyl-ACP dehydratase FabZ [Deltaproteobacteria bacterium]|nr:3-hydroxyacyl-ACP dehydratase FabZ [Deltaproteobacteria bacterium]
MNIEQIREILPHRYPFLLVDKVLELDPGKWCKAVKNVTINEPFFQGHFPGYPLMPGVLSVEALAQTSGIVAQSANPEQRGGLMVFAGIDKVRFKIPVVPGDQLILESRLLSNKRTLWIFEVQATVDGKVATQGEIKMVSVDRTL